MHDTETLAELDTILADHRMPETITWCFREDFELTNGHLVLDLKLAKRRAREVDLILKECRETSLGVEIIVLGHNNKSSICSVIKPADPTEAEYLNIRDVKISVVASPLRFERRPGAGELQTSSDVFGAVPDWIPKRP